MSLMIASSAAALALALQGTPQAHYQLSIEDAPDGRPHVTVELRFDGETDGSTRLHLPDEWGGEPELWNGIRGLSVEGAEISPGDEPFVRVLSHAPGAELVVRYQLVQDREGTPSYDQSNYRPILQPGYLNMIGYAWVVEPDPEVEREISFEVQTHALWAFGSDLEHGISTMEDLTRSVLVAGDFRVLETEIDGEAIRIGVRGENWPFADEEFAEEVGQVVAASHQYWGTPTEPYFVSMIPVEAPANSQSLGGTNLGDSFAFFATSNMDRDILREILVHEYSHNWMPSRLGGGIEGEQEPAGYWLSEGFNDYLTQRIGVLGHVWTAEWSIGSWNEKLQEYWTSPVYAEPNSTIVTNFWANRNYQRLPYLRGMMFAALVEHRIREATNGQRDLDDVFRLMLDNEAHDHAIAAFLPLVATVSGLDLSDEFRRHIIEGQPVEIPAGAFGACGEVVSFEQPVFVYGITWADRNDDGDQFLESVEPGSNAEAAGFRPGMKFLERVGGAYGDASQETVFRVEDNGEVRDIGYWPTNGETFPLQQIEVAENVDWQACHAVLAGQ